MNDTDKSNEPSSQAKRLSAADQETMLGLLLRGASPQIACSRLAIDTEAFWQTADADPEFRRRLENIQQLMTFNIVSILYKSAIEGKVPAQALWLRTFPPPAWSEDDEEKKDAREDE